MYLRIFIVLLTAQLNLTCLNAQAQPPSNQVALIKIVQADANRMGQTFVKGKYEAYTRFLYPPMIKMMGGTANVAKILLGTDQLMKDKGIKLNSITFDRPSSVVKSGNELQAKIVQHTNANTPSGKSSDASTLIAISQDNGAHWTFFDTKGRSISEVRHIFPNISTSL